MRKKEFCLIPNADEIAQLKSDYAMMIKSDMFLNKPVAFDDLIEELKILQNAVNQI